MNSVELLRRLAGQIRKKGMLDTIEAACNICSGLLDYHFHRSSLRSSKLPPVDSEKIRSEMEQLGLEVTPYQVDIIAFHQWLQLANFPENYKLGYGSLFIQKALEHFVGASLLAPKPDDVLLDVAAAGSPWASIAQRLYGCKSVALDLRPPTSPQVDLKLAADATKMPFRDESVDCMALHCAYEAFEGDADSRLILEASRALRQGGRMVILPLYMHHLYFADSSPGADRRGLDYQGARRVWREGRDGRVRLGGVRFSRKYSVEALKERVVKFQGPLRLTIFYIENEKEVDSVCYLKFAALFDK